ncbi:MAG TPA: hypothetical protein VE714_04290, partial [Gemmatimonadales bacterium]|nr:hypothetical protein [Gemmatimonadales bacterium]
MREHVEHFARRVPSGDSLGIGGKHGQSAIPSARQLTPLHQVDFGRKLGIFRPIACKKFGPTGASLRTALADSSGE